MKTGNHAWENICHFQKENQPWEGRRTTRDLVVEWAGKIRGAPPCPPVPGLLFFYEGI